MRRLEWVPVGDHRHPSSFSGACHEPPPRRPARGHDLGLSHDLPQLVERGRRAWAAAGCSASSAASASPRSPAAPATTPTPPTHVVRRAGPTGPRVAAASGTPTRRSRSPTARSPRRRPVPTRATGPTDPTCSPSPASCAGHHQQLRLGVRRRRGRPGDGQAQGLRPQRRRRDAARRRRGLPVALRPRRAATRCTTATRSTRTTCAASRRRPTDGTLSFTTIFPACYAGRWPHMHFEVYESLDAATSATDKLRTSQLALPQDVCETVYATEGYEQSVGNLAQVSLDTDGIFSDGYSLQMANGHRVGRRGLRRHPQRPGLTAAGHRALVGWGDAVRPASRRPGPGRRRAPGRRPGRASAPGRSGCTCTCRSARCGAATATSTPTPRSSWAVRRRPSPRRRTPGSPRTRSGSRRRVLGPTCAAGVDGVRRRRHADAARRRRPGRPAGRGRRRARARGGRRGHHRGQPGQRRPGRARAAAGGGLHPGLVRHAVGRPARAGHARPDPRPGAGAAGGGLGAGRRASTRSAST